MLPILLAARWQPSLLMFDYALGDKMACIIHCKARASLAGIRQLAALFLHSAWLLSQKNVGTHHFVFNKKSVPTCMTT
ncbi:hypothetical protein MCEREM3_00077 [Methylophilaceae bacterium]